jgi:hypothetical protein
MSEKVEVQIRIAQGRKSFTILEATMLWCELDTHDKDNEKWIRAIHAPQPSHIDQSFLYSPYLPPEVTKQLRKLAQELVLNYVSYPSATNNDELNRLSDDFLALNTQAAEILESDGMTKYLEEHTVMQDKVSTLVRNMNEICGDDGNDLDKQISRDQLRDLAKIRKDQPRFLDGKKEDDIHPKTRTTWLRLIATLCLAAKYDPRTKGMDRALAELTQSYGLDVSHSHIAEILKEIRDKVDLPRPV